MRKTIVVFGDSISWGANDWKEQGWSNMLRRELEHNNYDVKYYDASISGGNSSHLLDRFETEEKHRNPDIIIFAIGMNDTQGIGERDNRAVPIRLFEDNIYKIFSMANYCTGSKKGGYVFVVGITNVDEKRLSPNEKGKYYINSVIMKYNSILKQICKEKNIEFIPTFGILKDENLDDGLHPTTEGHRKIFSLLFKKIIKRLDKK